MLLGVVNVGCMFVGGRKGGPGCFVAGTEVQTPDGRVPIEHIEAGDEVFSAAAEATPWVAASLSPVELPDDVEPSGRFVVDRMVFAARGQPQAREVRWTGEIVATVVSSFSRDVNTLVDAHILHPDDQTEVISGTPEHPFYVPAEGRFVPLGELELGTGLRLQDGSEAMLVELSWRQGDFKVFNFEVDGAHNYFVSSADSQADAILVHNMKDCSKTASVLGRLTDIPWGRYCRRGCEAVAIKIQHSIGGTIHRIKPKSARARSLGPRGGTDTYWAHHDVVVKDGRVYDAMTGPNGLPIDEFKAQWGYSDAIDFGF